jgi:hypothetical protein
MGQRAVPCNRNVFFVTLILLIGCAQPRNAPSDNTLNTDKAPDAATGQGGVDPDQPPGPGEGTDPKKPYTDPGCDPGFHKCDGTCVSSSDPQHCGSACLPCAGVTGGQSTCDGHKCGVQCPAGKKPCLDACVDDGAACEGKCGDGKNPCGGICVEATNVTACGTACVTCPTSQFGQTSCDGDKCVLVCNTGYHACASACASDTDPMTCGAGCSPCPIPTGGKATCDGSKCGSECPAGTTLCNGSCIAVGKACAGNCPTGTHNCGGNCVSNTDTANCGTSCTPCKAPSNGKSTCDGSSCAFTCQTGFHRCGDECKDNKSVNSCGTSCSPCSDVTNGDPSCNGTTCGVRCNPALRDCGKGTCSQCCSAADCPVKPAACNNGTCEVLPVDCQVSAFGGWSACSKSCGGGTRSRSRTVTVQPKNGGNACPALTESEGCNTQGCPVDCQVSAFTGWSGCSKACEGGTQSRSRSVTVQPQNGGNACPALTESRSCNTQACPVDCQVGPFSGWTTCSKDCGGGTQSRSRSVTVQPQNGGDGCPALTESRSCNTQTCEPPPSCETADGHSCLGILGHCCTNGTTCKITSRFGTVGCCPGDPGCQ